MLIKFSRTLVTIIFSASLLACDQLPNGNRYEIVVDKPGRAVRLDKRTGEVLIIDGEKLIVPKDAEQIKRDQIALFGAKKFTVRKVRHMSMEANLTTSWQDGRLYYDVTIKPLNVEPTAAQKEMNETEKSQKTLAAFVQNFQQHEFYLVLEDIPFEFLRTALTPTYITDEKGDIASYVAKGNSPMPEATYKRIDSWNILWQKR